MKDIANRVMFLGRWNMKASRSIMMRAACDCAREDCDIHIDLEYDREFGTIDMTFSKNVYFFDYIRDPETAADKIINIIHRVKIGIKLIFTGYIEMNEDFTFIGEDQITDFIKALQQGKDYITSGNLYYCMQCKQVKIKYEWGLCSDKCKKIWENV